MGCFTVSWLRPIVCYCNLLQNLYNLYTGMNRGCDMQAVSAVLAQPLDYGLLQDSR